MSKHSKHIPCLITIFGATGDLSHRKLFPSLFHLFQQDNLDEHIAIIELDVEITRTKSFVNKLKVLSKSMSKIRIKLMHLWNMSIILNMM